MICYAEILRTLYYIFLLVLALYYRYFLAKVMCTNTYLEIKPCPKYTSEIRCLKEITIIFLHDE